MLHAHELSMSSCDRGRSRPVKRRLKDRDIQFQLVLAIVMSSFHNSRQTHRKQCSERVRQAYDKVMSEVNLIKYECVW